jgi:hypothetical protein
MIFNQEMEYHPFRPSESFLAPMSFLFTRILAASHPKLLTHQRRAIAARSPIENQPNERDERKLNIMTVLMNGKELLNHN